MALLPDACLFAGVSKPPHSRSSTSSLSHPGVLLPHPRQGPYRKRCMLHPIIPTCSPCSLLRTSGVSAVVTAAVVACGRSEPAAAAGGKAADGSATAAASNRAAVSGGRACDWTARHRGRLRGTWCRRWHGRRRRGQCAACAKSALVRAHRAAASGSERRRVATSEWRRVAANSKKRQAAVARRWKQAALSGGRSALAEAAGAAVATAGG